MDVRIAGSETQNANSTQFREKIEKKSYKFLVFIQESIAEKAAKEGRPVNTMTMDELLLRKKNNRLVSLKKKKNGCLVAAQTLQHILFLASSAYIVVQQDEAYGNIKIQLGREGS